MPFIGHWGFEMAEQLMAPRTSSGHLEADGQDAGRGAYPRRCDLLCRIIYSFGLSTNK